MPSVKPSIKVKRLGHNKNNVQMSTNQSVSVTERKRLTVDIPAAIDRDLEIYCVTVGGQKNEVTALALSEYLNKRVGEILQDLVTFTKH